MGLAQDLLLQAHHLVSYEGAYASQASLRRAVSTAYYGLFHLLVEDAALRWPGSPEARTGIERSFNHGSMRAISERFRTNTWKDWVGNIAVIPNDLTVVAFAFATLQEQRHKADYDNSEMWTAQDADAMKEILLAGQAFQAWESIRTDPMAGNYLVAVLLGKARV